MPRDVWIGTCTTPTDWELPDAANGDLAEPPEKTQPSRAVQFVMLLRDGPCG